MLYKKLFTGTQIIFPLALMYYHLKFLNSPQLSADYILEVRIPLHTPITSSYHTVWATVCKTVYPLLSPRCLSVCLSVPSCLAVSLVHRPGDWMKWNAVWHVGGPLPHCIYIGTRTPPSKWARPHSIFGTYLLRPNGWTD